MDKRAAVTAVHVVLRRVLAYRRSPALSDWRTVRRANINELRRAHALVGNVGPGSGSGRPAKRGTQQLNEALVLRVVTEFQGFVRDLLDLGTLKLIRGAGCATNYQWELITAASRDRSIDRGNPNLEIIRRDSARLGITELGTQLLAANVRHSFDAAMLKDLVELRNALAHSDEDKLLALSLRRVRPTIGYVQAAQASLDRHAGALDRVMWDHLTGLFPRVDPWSG